MSLRFYADVHVSQTAVRQLQKKGVDIIHCGDVGMADADDPDHLAYAIAAGRVMVTCDEDFVGLHADLLASGESHAGIVYLRMKDQCKSVSVIVRVVLFLHEVSTADTDLVNVLWRPTS